jgi:DNA-binding CsgD family transcriptional regulator
MSYAALPAAIRQTAETHLTPKQLHVLKLHLAGCGARRISTMLQIHRTTVRDHLKAAHDTLEEHGVTRDENGDYHQERTAA